jgi:hypothetical protein
MSDSARLTPRSEAEGRPFDPVPDHIVSLICGNATCRNRVRRPLDVHSAYRASEALTCSGRIGWPRPAQAGQKRNIALTLFALRSVTGRCPSSRV